MKILATVIGILVVGFILLAILLPALNASSQATYTRVATWQYGQIRLQAERGTLAQAAAALKDALEFWPGKISRDSQAAATVAALRDSTVRDIIARMRLLSGEDLGQEPEPWLKKYYQAPNPQGPITNRAPLSVDTNLPASAAASNR